METVGSNLLSVVMIPTVQRVQILVDSLDWRLSTEVKWKDTARHNHVQYLISKGRGG